MTIPMTLRKWIDQSKLDWKWLATNTNAVSFLEENLNKVDWVTNSILNLRKWL